ncbi:DUF4129 domain-containing protein [Mycobacterium sp.]|uniref:DUF4129 domain-containing protein n=1 Tax=Mycobacterium sp. TaxID=1785 RepID=UPI003D6B923A
MPTIDVDRDAAHQAAQNELAKPIYLKPSAAQRFHDWVDDLMYRLVEKASSVPGGWLTITVLLIALLVGVVIAYRIARQTMRTRRGDDYQLFDAGQLSAAQHRAAAEGFAAEGNWTAAIRHRVRAIAREFEETGLLNPTPGRTANELAREAGGRLPHLASELSAAATAFNDVTYGEQPGTPAAYQMIVDLDNHLHSAARQPAMSGPQMPDPWVPAR